MGRLAGRVAVVTGASSGIGLACARAFHAEGARVVLFARDGDALARAAAPLGAAALAVAGDVTSDDDLRRLFARTGERFGRVDALLANAGVSRLATLEGTDEALVDEVLAVNLKGTLFTVKHALGHLGDGASVILTGSAAASLGTPGTAAYAASKAGVRSLARTLSGELVSRGVRVNVLTPGAIETEATRAQVRAARATLIARIPAARPGTPEEVAAAAVFLASPESAYLAGAELVVDGGWTQLGLRP